MDSSSLSHSSGCLFVVLTPVTSGKVSISWETKPIIKSFSITGSQTFSKIDLRYLQAYFGSGFLSRSSALSLDSNYNRGKSALLSSRKEQVAFCILSIFSQTKLTFYLQSSEQSVSMANGLFSALWQISFHKLQTGLNSSSTRGILFLIKISHQI